MGLGFGTRIWDSDIHRPSRRGRDGGGERAGRRRERQPEKAPMMEGGGEGGRKRASKREREEGGRGTERERERDGGMEGGDARGTRGPPSPAHAGACSPRHGPGPTGPGPQPCGPRPAGPGPTRVHACKHARARARVRNHGGGPRTPVRPCAGQTIPWSGHATTGPCPGQPRGAAEPGGRASLRVCFTSGTRMCRRAGLPLPRCSSTRIRIVQRRGSDGQVRHIRVPTRG